MLSSLAQLPMDRKVKNLADIAGMAEAGCHAISEDGKSVMNASLYRKGMKDSKEGRNDRCLLTVRTLPW